MPRDLPLANGRMLVNFDATYNLRDIYWPHIGYRNNTQGHVNHTGVWVDGTFAWFDAPEWQRSLLYEPDTLATQVALTHPALQLQIACTDVVDFDRDVLLRKLRVLNTASTPRTVRLYFHHDWHINESEGGDTVYYQPDLHALIAYKEHCYLLVAGITGDARVGEASHVRQDARPMSQWATGYKEFNGLQGTWRDAEDGVLGGNPIAQGSVDSCVGFDLGTLGAGEARYCYTWLAAGSNFSLVSDTHQMVMERGPEALVQRTRDFWRLWLDAKFEAGAETTSLQLGDLPQPLVDLYKRSLLLIRSQIDNDGAIIAATDGDVWQFARDSYAYMWPRDGALVANVLSHAGYSDITSQFFHFCARAMSRDGYLLHKYTPDGALGSSWHPWVGADGKKQLPIQEDETALVIYSLWQHYALFRDVEFVRPLYRPLVKAAADFMVAFREPHTRLPAASWDLWEERFGIHAFTVAAVHAGLIAACNFATAFGETPLAATYREAADEIQAAAREYLWNEQAGRFARMVTVDALGTVQQDLTIDASLSGLFTLGLFDPTADEIRKTMQAVEQRLTVKTAVGGVARYENDYYHRVSQDIANVPGNPWFICACWLAEYHIATAQSVEQLHAAWGWLEWVQRRMLPSGVLAEQVNPYTDEPLSVSPLTWSHAQFASSVRWYAGKYRHLTHSSGT